MRVEVGDKIKIDGERMRYTVRCRDERYIICTKPINIRHTVLYFIIDLIDKWRGPDDRIFCNGYETDEQCRERLKELENEEIHVSLRRGVPFDQDIQ